MASNFPPEQMMRERDRETKRKTKREGEGERENTLAQDQSNILKNLISETTHSKFLPYIMGLREQAWYNIEDDYTRVYITGVRDRLGPSWKLATIITTQMIY